MPITCQCRCHTRASFPPATRIPHMLAQCDDATLYLYWPFVHSGSPDLIFPIRLSNQALTRLRFLLPIPPFHILVIFAKRGLYLCAWRRVCLARVCTVAAGSSQRLTCMMPAREPVVSRQSVPLSLSFTRPNVMFRTVIAPRLFVFQAMRIR